MPNFTDNKVDRAYESFMKQVPGFQRDPPEAKTIQRDIDKKKRKGERNQDPEKILDYVLNGKHDDPTFSYDGTAAKWDPTLQNSNDTARDYFGSWDDIEDEIRGSSAVANGFVQTLTHSDSDRFYITAWNQGAYP